MRHVSRHCSTPRLPRLSERSATRRTSRLRGGRSAQKDHAHPPHPQAAAVVHRRTDRPPEPEDASSKPSPGLHEPQTGSPAGPSSGLPWPPQGPPSFESSPKQSTLSSHLPAPESDPPNQENPPYQGVRNPGSTSHNRFQTATSLPFRCTTRLISRSVSDLHADWIKISKAGQPDSTSATISSAGTREARSSGCDTIRPIAA